MPQSLLFSWIVDVYSFSGVENRSLESSWEIQEVLAFCFFSPGQGKASHLFLEVTGFASL